MRGEEDRLKEYVSESNKNWQSKCDLLKQKVGEQQGEVTWARMQMDSALENNRGLEAKAKMHAEQLAVAVKNAALAVTAEHNTFKSEICGVLRRHGMESLVAPPFSAPHVPEPPAPGATNPSKPPCAENAVQWIQYINSTASVPDKVMAEFLNNTHCMTCKVLKGKCFYCGGPVVDAHGRGNFMHSDGPANSARAQRGSGNANPPPRPPNTNQGGDNWHGGNRGWPSRGPRNSGSGHYGQNGQWRNGNQ